MSTNYTQTQKTRNSQQQESKYSNNLIASKQAISNRVSENGKNNSIQATPSASKYATNQPYKTTSRTKPILSIAEVKDNHEKTQVFSNESIKKQTSPDQEWRQRMSTISAYKHPTNPQHQSLNIIQHNYSNYINSSQQETIQQNLRFARYSLAATPAAQQTQIDIRERKRIEELKNADKNIVSKVFNRIKSTFGFIRSEIDFNPLCQTTRGYQTNSFEYSKSKSQSPIRSPTQTLSSPILKPVKVVTPVNRKNVAHPIKTTALVKQVPTIHQVSIVHGKETQPSQPFQAEAVEQVKLQSSKNSVVSIQDKIDKIEQKLKPTNPGTSGKQTVLLTPEKTVIKDSRADKMKLPNLNLSQLKTRQLAINEKMTKDEFFSQTPHKSSENSNACTDVQKKSALAVGSKKKNLTSRLKYGVKFEVPEINKREELNDDLLSAYRIGPERFESMARKIEPLTQGQDSMKFTWPVARALIKLVMKPASEFSMHGVPWSSWEFCQIPTLGNHSYGTRFQEMYKATIPLENYKRARVFVKAVPADVWKQQWDYQNQWEGEYVTDSENFVMEAAALAFLGKYRKGLAPELYSILELSTEIPKTNKNSHSKNRKVFNAQKNKAGETITHIAIVSEHYGMDLLHYFECRFRQRLPLTDYEKMLLQQDCVKLLLNLHQTGLAHLDVTPENILYGRKGLILCDFSKTTPLHTSFLRHTNKRKKDPNSKLPFESCEPTVGKNGFMPPECWKVFWRLDDQRIQYPLTELSSVVKQSERSSYYFSVEAADVYMAGVLLVYVWAGQEVWGRSDPRQDPQYRDLIRSKLNFDLFEECRSWPFELKNMLQGALQPNPKQRCSLKDLLEHCWFEQARPMTARQRIPEQKNFLKDVSGMKTARTHYQPRF